MARRKAGSLLPIEIDILRLALDLRARGLPSFHGFGIAQALRAASGARSLTAHGTLYKALGRLEDGGLLTSTWEAADIAEGRPRRRLYQLTGEGARVAAAATTDTAAAASPAPRVRPEPA